MTQKFQTTVANSWRFRRRIGRSDMVRATQGRAVGAIERGDPIPPGVYWLDIVEGIAPNGVSKFENFQFWIQANIPPAAPTTRIKLLRSRHTPRQDSPGDIPYTEDPTEQIRASEWHLFEILEPVNRWGHDTALGLPSIAPEGSATTEDDTIQSPEVPGFWDTILPESRLGKATVIVGGVVITGLVIYGLTR